MIICLSGRSKGLSDRRMNKNITEEKKGGATNGKDDQRDNAGIYS